MDGGASAKSSEEKGAERLMDDYLKTMGLHRKRIAKDGSCLFRAVAEQVLHCQSLHTKVRAKCVEFLQENRGSYEAFIEGDFEDYLFKLQDPQQWVGEVEINALSVIYKRDFLIFQEPGKPAVHITDNDFKDKVRLCFLNGNHYDSVYPVSFIRGAALCQSILYELLYDGVFQAERSSLGSCHRPSRPADVLSDDGMNACISSDDSDLEAGEPWVENVTNTTRQSNQRGRGRGRLLPERVRRSLNPTLFRNVEYDVWQKSKRAQQKLDYCIAAGMQFTVGDRCQVRLDAGGRSFSATIKEVSPNNGPVTVYLEELGTRKQVPLWSLRPPNNENSWSTVVNRDKRLSNGHGEWEERGKGRGRGKNLAASSSSSSPISPAAPPSATGRVQKQHSWPPQATVEEGAAKSVRKSLSSVDPPFGLTDKQRSAKEDQNLKEIHLWDENSFPALGTRGGMQTDGGRRKGGEKRTKTKSPVDDVGASSPGERPKSSTPPPPESTPAPPSSSLPALSSSLPAAPSANSDSNNSAQTNAQGSPPPLPPSATLFLTPALAPASSPPTPPAISSSSSSSLPPKSSSSPPASSSLPPPTFIAPIAPSPTAAQGFLPHSSLPPHSPSPTSFFSSSVIHQAALVREAPPPSAPSSLNVGTSLSSSQSSSMPMNQISVAQTRTRALLTQGEVQMQGVTHQHQPQSHPEVASLPHTQTQPSLPQVQVSHPQVQVSHPQSQVQVSHPQSQVQVSHPQSQVQVSHPQSQVQVPHFQPQPQVQVPHFQSQPQVQVPHFQPQSQVQYFSQASGPHPPHPSQVPHPSLSLQPPIPQNPTEATLAPPHPESTVHGPSHPHPPQPAPPPPHQSILGAVPLQQLSQLFQDPLYPGFPQGELGEVAATPLFSSSSSGDDLPQDLNILKFFFNLGIKAYAMPMCPPYIYLLPLQQAHAMHPQHPSRSPSPTPHYHHPPSRQQEAYPHPQYPPQYEQQAPPPEPPHPGDPQFGQAGYPFTQPPPHRMSSPSLSWQQNQMPPPRNAGYQVGYPTTGSPYRASPPLSQGYHPGQGHPMYPQYPPEELQGSQGPPEKRQPTNGDPMPGRGLLEGPASANVANANNRTAVPGFALKKEPGDGLTRAVLLVDPPFNNRPIMKLVSKPDVGDVSMATRSSPGSPLPGDSRPSRGYRRSYVQLGAPEPGRGGYTESLSVGCSTEDDWGAGLKPTSLNPRGARRNPRGPRGRGGPRRRHGGDPGADLNYIQFNPSHRGRGRERGY
ncbi:OTU domain-containing protein 4 [Cyclopterus lumpus]|uniref:OTU domain-containing protein 4 n=1 Tax=Cyclopterus lumpus TaxID=8103 RepID=UPI0014861EBF|nr:OTU domain-containing protein 4 [Cyclopterus lumpus]